MLRSPFITVSTGRINMGASLWVALKANALLFLALGALIVAPAVGGLLLVLLVTISKRNGKLARLWLRYYKEIINIEYNLKRKD